MEIKDFVRQLNYPSRKIDGNFLLNNKVPDVQAYIDEAELNRQVASEERTLIINSNREKTEKLLTYLLDEVGIDQWKIFKKKKRGRGWSATTVRGDMYAHYRKFSKMLNSMYLDLCLRLQIMEPVIVSMS